MTQFNFTTNIEKRMPETGKVFCIDRMTSDYAEQHPLDVDAFIESVFQEFKGTEFEEPREVLKKVWVDVMSDTNQRGNALLFPNKDGKPRAAAMKVWHKAGDYWRRGFRQVDTLPDMVPMTKITRLDDGGWIALFQKDAHLMENGELKIENCTVEEATESTDNNEVEHAQHHTEPRQLDLFAFERLQQENERLQAQIAQMQAQQSAERFAREETSHRSQPKRRNAPVRRQQSQAVAVAIEEHKYQWLKVAGYLVAGLVAVLVIWQTGLLIPLGLIGLATSGLIK